MTAQPKTLADWLAAVPCPAVPHERTPEGRVVLLRPKFTAPWMQWLQRRLRRSHFRVKLDAVGSCFWLHCDGTRSVAELAELLRVAFGQGAEPSEDRAVGFALELGRGGFIRLG